MKNLIEISKIVTKKKVKKIEIFDDATLKNKGSKFNEFYEALMLGKFKNDRDAAQFLYDCSPTDDKYRQLKSRFKKRLLNTLFFLDVNLPDNSNYDRAYYTCNKDWSLVKILLSNNAIETADSLASQILNTALKYKFADLIVSCARILRTYAAESDNDKTFEDYDQLIKTYSNILDAEIRSEELYQRVYMNYYKPMVEKTDLSERIDTYCEALVGLSEMYDSPVIIYNMYMVWSYKFEMMGDYESMIEVCTKAEKYIEDNPTYYQELKTATFHIKKMTAFLHLKDFRRGKVDIEKSLNDFPEGDDLWFDFMEYYFLLSMHTENYINAMAVFNKATSNIKFKKVDKIKQEKWKIYEVYLKIITELYSSTNPILGKQMKKTTRATKSLTEPILYPKEFKIFGAYMYIAQFLHHLERKTYSNATDTVEILKTLANQQLKKEENYRLIQFIRLLQQLSKANYKIEEISNSEKYFQKLKETPFRYRGLINELEVIPFELLINIIYKKLK
jgi:hypothetical protein